MAVNHREILDQLEERLTAQGIRLIYGDLQTEGGLCRLRDSRILIINRRAATATRARLITDALARLEAEAARSASARAGAGALASGEKSAVRAR